MKKKLWLLLILLPLLIISSHNSRLNAAGNQFRGILPPKRVHKKAPEPTELEVKEEKPYPELHMIVNIPARKVMLFDEGKEVARHDIAVGQPVYKTPPGGQEINTIIWNPWWIPPNSPWARGSSKTPPGPSNPLGPVKMMMQQGIRLHGTNKASSIGLAASHGCLRMRNENAASLAWYIQKRINNSDDSLFEKYSKNRRSSYHVKLDVPVTVDIIYEPVEVRNGVLHIYYDIYGWAGNLKTEVVNALIKGGIDLKEVDEERIAELAYPKKRNNVVRIKVKDIFSETPILSACYEEGR